jgi:hypothetical protein
MANSSFMFLTFDLLIVSSLEKRCAPKSWWTISQLCGSGLSRRSNVTSAACSGAALASSAPASAVRTAVDFRFIILSLTQIRFCLFTASQPVARNDSAGKLQAEHE